MSSGDARPSRFAVFAPCVFTAGRIVCGFLAVVATFNGMLSLRDNVTNSVLNSGMSSTTTGNMSVESMPIVW